MTALNGATDLLFTPGKSNYAVAGGILYGLDAGGGGNGGIEIVGSANTNLVYIDFSYPYFDYVSRILADLSNGNLSFLANGSTTLSIDGLSKAATFSGLITAQGGINVSSGSFVNSTYIGPSSFSGLTTLNGGLSLPSGASISTQLPCIYMNNPQATSTGTSGSYITILWQTTVATLSRSQSLFSYNATTGGFTIPYTGIYRCFLRAILASSSTNGPGAVFFQPNGGSESMIYSLPRGALSGCLFIDLPLTANGILRFKLAEVTATATTISSTCECQITFIN
jgi:hypothetical protein